MCSQRIRDVLGGFDRIRMLLLVEGHLALSPPAGPMRREYSAASSIFTSMLGERGAHTRTALSPAYDLNLVVELVVTAAIHDAFRDAARAANLSSMQARPNQKPSGLGELGLPSQRDLRRAISMVLTSSISPNLCRICDNICRATPD